ncbi:MAG: hypothetical protein JWN15_106 [Firmicutes bacterium]|nr:hypothetical protein [Bacillota bacterium]
MSTTDHCMPRCVAPRLAPLESIGTSHACFLLRRNSCAGLATCDLSRVPASGLPLRGRGWSLPVTLGCPRTAHGRPSAVDFLHEPLRARRIFRLRGHRFLTAKTPLSSAAPTVGQSAAACGVKFRLDACAPQHDPVPKAHGRHSPYRRQGRRHHQQGTGKTVALSSTAPLVWGMRAAVPRGPGIRPSEEAS